MDAIPETAQTIASVPPDQMLIIVALAAICLAGFAIYAVYSLARRKEKDRESS